MSSPPSMDLARSSPLKRRRSESSSSQSDSYKAPRRPATLYDAVAGRIGAETFLADEILARDGEAVYPEEVLFRQKDAPVRYEETDPYFAHEKLDPDTQPLPDSDLLKAIHQYASHFYEDAPGIEGDADWRSMDETALLAMGILLEESIAHDLGPTGDLAFIECEDADEGILHLDAWDGQQHRRSVLRSIYDNVVRSRETEGQDEPDDSHHSDEPHSEDRHSNDFHSNDSHGT